MFKGKFRKKKTKGQTIDATTDSNNDNVESKSGTTNDGLDEDKAPDPNPDVTPDATNSNSNQSQPVVSFDSFFSKGTFGTIETLRAKFFEPIRVGMVRRLGNPLGNYIGIIICDYTFGNLLVSADVTEHYDLFCQSMSDLTRIGKHSTKSNDYLWILRRIKSIQSELALTGSYINDLIQARKKAEQDAKLQTAILNSINSNDDNINNVKQSNTTAAITTGNGKNTHIPLRQRLPYSNSGTDININVNRYNNLDYGYGFDGTYGSIRSYSNYKFKAKRSNIQWNDAKAEKLFQRLMLTIRDFHKFVFNDVEKVCMRAHIHHELAVYQFYELLTEYSMLIVDYYPTVKKENSVDYSIYHQYCVSNQVEWPEHLIVEQALAKMTSNVSSETKNQQNNSNSNPNSNISGTTDNNVDALDVDDRRLEFEDHTGTAPDLLG